MGWFIAEVNGEKDGKENVVRKSKYSVGLNRLELGKTSIGFKIVDEDNVLISLSTWLGDPFLIWINVLGGRRIPDLFGDPMSISFFMREEGYCPLKIFEPKGGHYVALMWSEKEL